MDTKKCTVCNNIKNLNNFHKNKREKDGRTNECKQCRSERRKNKKMNFIYPEIKNTDMRTCNVCKLEKKLNDFHKSFEGPQGRFLSCKNCRNIKNVDTYAIADNGKKKKKAGKKRDRIIRNINFISTIKNNPCTDCRNIYESYCMEFDHIKNKKINVSRLVWDGASLEKIIEEIKQCELVCILCHRNRTFNRMNRATYISSNRKLFIELKKNPCIACGQTYNYWQMDFDHIDASTKKHELGKLVNKNDPAILLEELKLCQLLCALCHRRKSKRDNFELLRKNKKLIFSIYEDGSHQSEHMESRGKSGNLSDPPFH